MRQANRGDRAVLCLARFRWQKALACESCRATEFGGSGTRMEILVDSRFRGVYRGAPKRAPW